MDNNKNNVDEKNMAGNNMDMERIFKEMMEYQKKSQNDFMNKMIQENYKIPE